MNIDEFKIKYAAFKDADKITIPCDHPQHIGDDVSIGKQPAKRNILKNGSKHFICRPCFMKFNNPMNQTSESRQTNEMIAVHCPGCESVREMKKSCYYGAMEEPYMQMCGSCSQKGKTLTEDAKDKIRQALKGVPKSQDFKDNLAAYWKAHPERREEATAILLANKCTTGMLGKNHSDETKAKMSDAQSGILKTDKHCENISVGRKKMLADQGGFTKEHRENLSKATIRQYQNGFDPNLHHLKGYHNSPKAGPVYYRSSYEKKAYLKLDADDTVKTYHAENVPRIEYFNPKKQIMSNYLVDIDVEYIDGSVKWIEVKPEKWLADAEVCAKIEAGQKEAAHQGIEFEIWTEMNLFGHVYNQKHMRDFVEKVKKGEL